MTRRSLLPAGLLAVTLLPACSSSHTTEHPVTGTDGSVTPAAADAGFTCVPPDGGNQPPQTFSGKVFDPSRGCLIGPSVTLPVCGCWHSGKDSSTWCFAAPDGTTYFAISADQCSVEMPPGWYAEQSFGPSPFGTGSAAQTLACSSVAAASTATGSYDRPGPPVCLSDAGGAPDASAACTGLHACIGSPFVAPVPMQASGVVDAANPTLCSMALSAVQEVAPGEQGGPCGPPDPSMAFPTNPPTGTCATLYACCPSLTEPGGADTCDVIALEQHEDACMSAIEYFRGLGMCLVVESGG